MTRWDAFTAVCNYLRAGLLKDTPLHRVDDLSWTLLVEVSSNHYVTPALAWCLKDQTEIPSEIREYFDSVLALNARRNEALLAGLARIVAALNAIGIEPVPLKGAARLIEADYPAPMLRFLGDLDVLIPAKRSADAVAALQSIGFSANADDNDLPPSHHHLPMLNDLETGAGVELHTAVAGHACAGIISTNWFCEGTSPLPFRNQKIRLPDATRSVGHIIAHDQLHHNGYRRGWVELRQALDLAMIRARRESAIDWAELDDRFCRMGRGEVLATYLEFVKILLGQAAPRFRSAPRPGAIKDFRRAITSARARRWRNLTALLSEYAANRRRDPGGVLRLLDLKKWPKRIDLVMKAFERGRPKW